MFLLWFQPPATGWLSAFDLELITDEPTRRHKGKWVHVAARAVSEWRSNRWAAETTRAGQRNRWLSMGRPS
jgi:hypothetical protein